MLSISEAVVVVAADDLPVVEREMDPEEDDVELDRFPSGAGVRGLSTSANRLG